MHSVIHSLTIRHSCLTSTKRQDYRYWKCWTNVPQGISLLTMNIQEHLESTSIPFYGTYKYSYHEGMIHWQTITQEGRHSESTCYPLVLCGTWVQQRRIFITPSTTNEANERYFTGVIHTCTIENCYVNKMPRNGHVMETQLSMADSPTHHTTTALRPFVRDHPCESVPEENFWTLWCKGRLTEADTLTIRLGTTPSGLTSAHLHHPHIFTGRMPFLPPNQQRQSTEGNQRIQIREKTLEFSSVVLPALSPYRDSYPL